MIFDIETKEDKIFFVEVIADHAWEIADLMPQCNYYIGCYNGFENCLVFNL